MPCLSHQDRLWLKGLLLHLGYSPVAPRQSHSYMMIAWAPLGSTPGDNGPFTQTRGTMTRLVSVRYPWVFTKSEYLQVIKHTCTRSIPRGIIKWYICVHSSCTCVCTCTCICRVCVQSYSFEGLLKVSVEWFSRQTWVMYNIYYYCDCHMA